MAISCGLSPTPKKDEETVVLRITEKDKQMVEDFIAWLSKLIGNGISAEGG